MILKHLYKFTWSTNYLMDDFDNVTFLNQNHPGRKKKSFILGNTKIFSSEMMSYVRLNI